ncbi:RTN4R [Branchiostoma lanceolatum]|uniref:RTN4R protein n=1 Tax=Branchiostoma lanceolatum TaxID=7740 RepID=A0A8J9ZT51_BRALA|nr:RTN4R [Branchiostoma lanceolatum]
MWPSSAVVLATAYHLLLIVRQNVAQEDVDELDVNSALPTVSTPSQTSSLMPLAKPVATTAVVMPTAQQPVVAKPVAPAPTPPARRRLLPTKPHPTRADDAEPWEITCPSYCVCLKRWHYYLETKVRHLRCEFWSTGSTYPEEYPGTTESARIKVHGLDTLPSSVFQGISTAEVIILEIVQNPDMTHIPKGAFKSFRSLGYLDLSENNLKEIQPSLFVGVTFLDKLYLQGNSLDKLYPNSFRGLGRLDTLNLEGAVDMNLTEGLLEPLEWLESLNLANNPKLTNLPGDTFSYQWNLQTLLLQFSGVKNPDDELFKPLNNLRHLEIDEDQLNSWDPDVLLSIESLETLEVHWAPGNSTSHVWDAAVHYEGKWHFDTCPEDPCINDGICFVGEHRLQCECPVPRAGSICQSLHPGLLFLIVVVILVILVAVAIPIYKKATKKKPEPPPPKPKPIILEPESEEEDDFMQSKPEEDPEM